MGLPVSCVETGVVLLVEVLEYRPLELGVLPQSVPRERPGMLSSRLRAVVEPGVFLGYHGHVLYSCQGCFEDFGVALRRTRRSFLGMPSGVKSNGP